jgi:type IV secretion system protein VirD4
MEIYMYVILGLAIMLILFLYFIEPRINRRKIRNDNEYGSARFATFCEIKRMFTKENISDIEEAGFPIWYSKDYKFVWFDKQTPHYVYLGSTGSGKSVTAVIPSCSFIATSKIKRSVFITDPKGEIYHTTSNMFKNNGYEVLTIDFRNPEFSNKFNLLEPIVKEYESYIEDESKENDVIVSIDSLKNSIDCEKEIETLKNQQRFFNNSAMKHLAETNRLITSLSTMIMTDKFYQKDPFWNNSAKNLLEGLIGLFLEEYKLGNINRNQITLTSIKKFQNSSMEEDNFEKLKEYVEKKPYGSKSKDSLISILSASENTYKSITAVFGEKMSLFDDVNVANITSNSDFNFDILGNKPTALFVIVPDEDKTYYSLITIIVGLLYRELVKLANSNDNKKLPVQIDWILDEFANCPPLADIEAIVSVARSRGMRFQFFIQSLSQLDNVYGKEVAQIILDNCGLVYLKTNTQETAEAISKRLGKKTIESNSISQSLSFNNYNGNQSVGLMGRELLTPDEIKQLHYKTIIFPTIGYPIFRDTVMFDKFICYKSGELEREPKKLEDLSYTYYTVEQIKLDKDSQDVQVDEKNLSDEAKDILSEKYEFNKLQLQEALLCIKQILNNQTYKTKYGRGNNSIFLVVNVSCVLNEYIIDQMKSSIDEEKYHLEIDSDEYNQTKIEVHLKSVF